ncbi:unnamed protein product [Brassica oleracea var. botrytis]
MYRDGLREEIRAELGVHVFSTIDDIMQAALDVEEGDESDESGNRSKEKSRSGECETSGDTDFSTTESDESGNRTKKKARTGEDFLQNLDGEEEDPGQADDNDAFNDSDGSVPQGVGGSDEESDSKVDLEDYKEYLEEHHRSESESSRESNLPPEVQGLVVKLVAHNSFEDLFRLRATCKAMRSLADDEDVYASFDLFKYPWRLNGFRLRYLLRRCYAHGNPSTLYIKGVEYFYRRNMYVEGLDLMKRAANAGFERASYTYAMTSKLWDDDGDHFRGFSRDYVAKIGLLSHRYFTAVLVLLCWRDIGHYGTSTIGRLKTCVTGASG